MSNDNDNLNEHVSPSPKDSSQDEMTLQASGTVPPQIPDEQKSESSAMDPFYPDPSLKEVRHFVDDAEYDESPDLKGLLFRHLRGRILIGAFLGLLGAALLGGAAYHLIKPKYTSRGIIRISPTTPSVLYQSEENRLLPVFDSYVAGQVAYLQSRLVLQRASMDPKIQELGWGEDALAKLAKAIKVNRAKRTETIEVVGTAGSGPEASTAVNALLAAYETMSGEKSGQQTTIREKSLLEHEENLLTKQSELKKSIVEIGQEYDKYTITRAHLSKVNQLQEMDLKIDDLEGSIAEMETFGAKKGAGDTGDGEITRLTVLDHAMADLLKDRARISARRGQMLQRYRKTHPKIRELDAQITVLEGAIEERRGQLATLGKTGMLTKVTDKDGEESLEQLKMLKQRLVMKRENVQKQTIELNSKRLKLADLDKQLMEVSGLLEEARKALEKVRVEANHNLPGRVEITVWASTPTAPSSDKRKPLTAGAGMAGFGSSFFFILVLSLLKQRIRYSDDVAAMAQGNNVMPALPLVNKQKQLNAYEFAIYQYAQSLQLRQHAGKGARTISISGLSSDSGKSMVAEDMCKALSDAGLRCLKVDFKFPDQTEKTRRKQKHSRSQQVGLLEDQLPSKVKPLKRAYAKNAELSRPGVGVKAMLHDVSQGVTINDIHQYVLESLNGKYARLPLIPGSDMQAKTLSGQQVAQMLELLKPHFDFIILDTAELLKALEASLVTSLTDESFIVLNPGVKGGKLKLAIEKFEELSGRTLSLVLNQALPNDPAFQSL